MREVKQLTILASLFLLYGAGSVGMMAGQEVGDTFPGVSLGLI